MNLLLSSFGTWIGAYATIWPEILEERLYLYVPYLTYIGILLAIIGIFVVDNEVLVKTNETLGYTKNKTVFIVTIIFVLLTIVAIVMD
jgi:hypothetical protein